jgi:hypothetical protein
MARRFARFSVLVRVERVGAGGLMTRSYARRDVIDR